MIAPAALRASVSVPIPSEAPIPPRIPESPAMPPDQPEIVPVRDPNPGPGPNSPVSDPSPLEVPRQAMG